MDVIVSTSGFVRYFKNNPAVSGWAAIMRCGNQTKVLSEGGTWSTKERLLLTAVIGVMKNLKKPCRIIVNTDSDTFRHNLASAKELRANNWVTKTHAKLATADLWEKIAQLKEQGGHTLTVTKVYKETEDTKRCKEIIHYAEV